MRQVLRWDRQWDTEISALSIVWGSPVRLSCHRWLGGSGWWRPKPGDRQLWEPFRSSRSWQRGFWTGWRILEDLPCFNRSNWSCTESRLEAWLNTPLKWLKNVVRVAMGGPQASRIFVAQIRALPVKREMKYAILELSVGNWLGCSLHCCMNGLHSSTDPEYLMCIYGRCARVEMRWWV